MKKEQTKDLFESRKLEKELPRFERRLFLLKCKCPEKATTKESDKKYQCVRSRDSQTEEISLKLAARVKELKISEDKLKWSGNYREDRKERQEAKDEGEDKKKWSTRRKTQRFATFPLTQHYVLPLSSLIPSF